MKLKVGLIYFVFVGAAIGFLYSWLLPSREMWLFYIGMPTKPKIAYEYDQKFWRTEVAGAPFEFTNSIKEKYGSSKDGAYVSNATWNTVTKDPYVEITIRSPKGHSPIELVSEITQYLNTQYSELSRKSFEQHNTNLNRLRELREQLQNRVKHLGVSSLASQPLAGAVADLLTFRIIELDQQIDFAASAIELSGSQSFRVLAPLTGAHAGAYPNRPLMAFAGGICGLVIGLLFQLFKSSARQADNH